jgi:hypothetical protein
MRPARSLIAIGAPIVIASSPRWTIRVGPGESETAVERQLSDIVIATVRAPLPATCEERVDGKAFAAGMDYRSATNVVGGMTLAEAEGEALGKGSAAELLSNWRAAERDRVAAEESSSVASLAASAATEAATAAEETASAARLSLEAAQRAERAALRTSEAAEVASRTANRESVNADAALESSKAAEHEAMTRFQSGQSRGFDKDGA